MAEKLTTVEQVNGAAEKMGVRKGDNGEFIKEQPARSGFLVRPEDEVAGRMAVLRARREGGDETGSDWTRTRPATADDRAKYEVREF